MTTIRGRRILIVEDNPLIGEFMASVVEDAGGIVIGPLCTSAAARDALDSGGDAADGAMLDLHLDRCTDDLADRLATLRLPFAFVTGARDAIPPRHSDRPVCDKPFTPALLLDALHRAFGAAAGT